MIDSRDFDVNGERFEEYRDQLQAVIDATFSKMMKKGLTSATITTKLDISLIPAQEIDKETGELKNVYVPMLESKAKFDAKLSGESGVLRIGNADQKLVFNKHTGRWSTSVIRTNQTDMFEDDDYDYEDDDNG